MDFASSIDVLQSIALAIALAACAGLRAWLPLFLGGLLNHLGVLHLSPNFSFLSQPRVVVLFGLATVIEIAADKIPAVDHTLDVLSTFLRPIAGSILAAAAMGWIRDPLTAIVLGVAVGAPTALVPHGAKAGLRALSSAFTLGLANPVISLIEDVAVVVLFVLAILIPLLVVALIAIVAGLLLWRRLHQRRLQPAA